MTIQEMKQRKQELGYSYAMISEKSGVPVSTIQKIFGGETTSPRYDTLQALEMALKDPADSLPAATGVLRERGFVYSTDTSGTEAEKYPRQGEYTIEDYYALPDDQRVELIDGVFYDMASPVPLHQLIAGEVYRQIANYILERGGSCMAYISPLDVQLDCDNRTMVQPDVMILCEKEKTQEKRVYGAPDFILEVISPSTRRKDCFLKLQKYMNAGVREYWILDPYKEKLMVYFFEEDEFPYICGLEEPIPVRIYQGQLAIDPKHILRWIRERQEES